MYLAAAASAENSLVREIAIWINIAAIGARIAIIKAPDRTNRVFVIAVTRPHEHRHPRGKRDRCRDRSGD